MKRTLINLLISMVLFSQSSIDTKGSKMTIDGTSTLHDWTSVVKSFNADNNVSFINDSLSLTKFNLTVDVASIKSGNESMDENTYEAMNMDDHPKIEYKLSNYKIIIKEDKKVGIKSTGQLTINGKSKDITMMVDIVKEENNIRINGQKKFKMSEYGIDPPTMFLGTIKTGDEVTIKFNLLIKINQEK